MQSGPNIAPCLQNRHGSIINALKRNIRILMRNDDLPQRVMLMNASMHRSML